MFRKILFANEGSSAADRALLYVEHLARVESAEVIVLHAFQVPGNYSTSDSYEDLHQAFQKVAWSVVDDVVGELERSGALVRGVVREAPPARAILEVADEESASLIVLGTRGPSSAQELLLGSVSTEVLRLARCPVMAVP
ncbi:MAG TPA: universal stress protein [Anaerolineae bacterium]|nr:universal stress protein [Anaerolineae bacterium]